MAMLVRLQIQSNAIAAVSNIPNNEYVTCEIGEKSAKYGGITNYLACYCIANRRTIPDDLPSGFMWLGMVA